MNEKPCPACLGVPVRPEIPTCCGCIECDFTGTLAAYRQTQRMERDAQQSYFEDCFPGYRRNFINWRAVLIVFGFIALSLSLCWLIYPSN